MIGLLIKRMRLEKKLTQKELGDMVFLDYRTISNYENNISNPSIQTIMDICKATGYEVILSEKGIRLVGESESNLDSKFKGDVVGEYVCVESMRGEMLNDSVLSVYEGIASDVVKSNLEDTISIVFENIGDFIDSDLGAEYVEFSMAKSDDVVNGFECCILMSYTREDICEEIIDSLSDDDDDFVVEVDECVVSVFYTNNCLGQYELGSVLKMMIGRVNKFIAT